jgi:hypothetical protein
MFVAGNTTLPRATPITALLREPLLKSFPKIGLAPFAEPVKTNFRPRSSKREVVSEFETTSLLNEKWKVKNEKR